MLHQNIIVQDDRGDKFTVFPNFILMRLLDEAATWIDDKVSIKFIGMEESTEAGHKFKNYVLGR